MNLTSATQLLSRKQIRSIAESTDARISVWSGAVRSGKTIASLIAFLIGIADAPPQGLILVVGRTLQTIERNVIEPLQDSALFGIVAGQIHHTRGATTAVILGRTVHLVGASDARAEGRIRGLTAYLAYVDEATLVPESFFNQLLARLSVPGARLLATTNPDGPAHWLRKSFILRRGELDLATWHFTLDDNPALDPSYVKALKAEYVGLWYRRFILGDWCLAEGAVYDMWDETTHVVAELPPIASWLAVGLDYGTTNPTSAVLLGLGADRRLYAAAEWRYDSKRQLKQLTDAQQSAAIREWLAGITVAGQTGIAPEYVVVDPSAASMRAQLYHDGLIVTPGSNEVLDGIRTVSTVLGADRLRIHRSCKGLLDELPGYSWDDQAAERGEDKPIKADDHSLDALRYAIHTTRAIWQPHVALAA
ncbi:PBSX family phage terminase large subunit [Stackebrandtia soli]|uniref:PBSX family phage terminase large subunit n=1 Tax=Stackebrandtia soli TaxID=1892856 RepID=UPI0039E775A7